MCGACRRLPCGDSESLVRDPGLLSSDSGLSKDVSYFLSAQLSAGQFGISANWKDHSSESPLRVNGRSRPFQPKLVVDSVSEFLLAAQVSFGRLN
jgi:hypothetical protein